MNWISVKDKLPNEEQDVLVLVRKIEHYGRHNEKRTVYHSVHIGWCIEEKWATTYCYGYKYLKDEANEKIELEVTHWMPLPELPKYENEVDTN